MEQFEHKFNTLIDTLKKNNDLKVTWDDTLTTAIKAGLITAHFDQIGGSKNVIYRKKRVNGYNLFMKDRMTQLKNIDTDSNHRMKQISEEWNKLTETDKDSWKQKAKDMVPVETEKMEVKVRKPRKSQISGYQLFVREKMAEMKDKFPPKERMSAIGKAWKALNEEQQGGYNTRTKNEVKVEETK